METFLRELRKSHFAQNAWRNGRLPGAAKGHPLVQQHRRNFL